MANPNTNFVQLTNSACTGKLTSTPGSEYVKDYIKEYKWNSNIADVTEAILLSDIFTVPTDSTCPITACTLYNPPVVNKWTPNTETKVALNAFASIDTTVGSAFETPFIQVICTNTVDYVAS
jgi:hypothetical protein